MTHGHLLVIDYGSQYTQLILRRVRGLGVEARAVSCLAGPDTLGESGVAGVILSGSPSSIYDPSAPQLTPGLLELAVPVLGICYGMQGLVRAFGGQVQRSERREFGRATLSVGRDDPLFEGLPRRMTVWMSHGDHVQELPDAFIGLASTENAAFAAIRHASRPIWGVQFHPEVVHTPRGTKLLENFARNICGLVADWNPGDQVDALVSGIRDRVGEGDRVIGALSGGVDSSVAAALVHRAVGSKLTCVFVDNGLLRRGEAQEVLRAYERDLELHLVPVDASATFLERLAGVEDPEHKRRIIGHTFIEVFEVEARRIEGCRFLVQGTLYPDVIESLSHRGPSATIKTHHNVGGLPDRMNLELIEPLRYFFKDEVREIGRRIGVPESILGRHPFPGPGLAIRVLGPVTPQRLGVLCNADRIFIAELRESGLYDQVWQAFAVLLPVSSVGVMGDERTYENVIVLRAVESVDGMTADWARLPARFLRRVSNRIINEVTGVNRVVYDISSKPPSTIEWE